VTSSTETTSFARRVRTETSTSHRGAEGAPLMNALLGEPMDRVAYVRYLSQLFVIYSELEDACDHLSDDAQIGAFLHDELARVPGLRHDLELLIGSDWRSRIRVLPATARYANRIRLLASSWPGGLLAHHYTRYLGDLSGGLFIGATIALRLDGDVQAAHQFFVFDDITDPGEFKNAYRGQLDELGWSPAEQDAFIEEVRLAYWHNGALMADVMASTAA
jgi:heme oxygenase